MNNNISDRQYIISSIRNNLSKNNKFVNTGEYSDRITPHFEENRPNMESYDRNLYQYQKDRENPYSTSIEQRAQQYNNTIDDIKNKHENAFRLYELPKDFTLKQLKKRYIVLSRLTHPDREGGSEEKFEFVSKHYLYLLEYYNARNVSSKYENSKNIPIKSLVEKKKSNRENQNDTFKKSSLKIAQGKQFDVKSFNKAFEQNALYDPSQEGYSSWLKNTKDENDKNLPNMSGKNFNHTVFNKQREKLEKSIVPNNISQIKSFNDNELSNMSLVNDTNNYSLVNSGAMDLKEVYSNGIINVSTDVLQRPKFKSQQEYEKYRTSKMTPLNQQEKQEIELQEKEFKAKEESRLHKLAERDAAISEHFMRIQGLLQ
jgi:curved DNA-binding protein CbpA